MNELLLITGKNVSLVVVFVFFTILITGMIIVMWDWGKEPEYCDDCGLQKGDGSGNGLTGGNFYTKTCKSNGSCKNVPPPPPPMTPKVGNVKVIKTMK